MASSEPTFLQIHENGKIIKSSQKKITTKDPVMKTKQWQIKKNYDEGITVLTKKLQYLYEINVFHFVI